MAIRTVTLLLLTTLLPGPGFAEDDADEALRLDRAKILAGGTVKLVFRFASEALPPGYSLDGETISLSVGGATLLSIPPIDDRASLRRGRNWRWTYRERRSGTRDGLRRMKIDLAAGKAVFRGRRLDTGNVFGGSTDGLSVVLTLGETRFSGAFDFAAKGKRISYKRRKERVRIGPSYPPPGIPPLEEPPSYPPIPASGFRLLYEGHAPNHPGTENRLIRDEATFLATWNETMTAPSSVGPWLIADPPAVDWENEMVIALFLGWRENLGYFVYPTKVDYPSSGPVVNYEEMLPYSCPVPDVPGCPVYWGAIHRAGGLASYVRTEVKDLRCPLR